MADIIIKDGQLWKDGVKLKLEFGNLEQITIIRKYEKRIAAFIKGEVYPDVSYTVTGHALFKCVCGENIYHETEAHHEEDVECFDTLKDTCHKCGKKYEFIVIRHYVRQCGKMVSSHEDLRVKLIK